MGLVKNAIIEAGTNLGAIFTEFVNCTKNTDTTVENAYYKVDNVVGDKNNLTFNLSVYTNKDGKLITDRRYNFIPSVAADAPNFIKQAYDYLKTLPEYADSVDA